MRFLLDENVDDAVGDFLIRLGHEVSLTRQMVHASAPDILLLHISLREGLIVITHDRDFRRLAKRIPSGFAGPIRKGAGRIQLNLPVERVIPRLEEVMDGIYVNYEFRLRKNQRFLAQISETQVSSVTNAPLSLLDDLSAS